MLGSIAFLVSGDRSRQPPCSSFGRLFCQWWRFAIDHRPASSTTFHGTRQQLLLSISSHVSSLLLFTKYAGTILLSKIVFFELDRSSSWHMTRTSSSNLWKLGIVFLEAELVWSKLLFTWDLTFTECMPSSQRRVSQEMHDLLKLSSSQPSTFVSSREAMNASISLRTLLQSGDHDWRRFDHVSDWSPDYTLFLFGAISRTFFSLRTQF